MRTYFSTGLLDSGEQEIPKQPKAYFTVCTFSEDFSPKNYMGLEMPLLTTDNRAEENFNLHVTSQLYFIYYAKDMQGANIQS